MGQEKLIQTALRVLTAINHRRKQDPADVQRLRETALPEEANLPDDLLACEIIKRETMAARKKRPAAVKKAP